MVRLSGVLYAFMQCKILIHCICLLHNATNGEYGVIELHFCFDPFYEFNWKRKMPIQQTEHYYVQIVICKIKCAKIGGAAWLRRLLDSMIQLKNVVNFIAPSQLLLNKLIVMIAVTGLIWDISKCFSHHDQFNFSTIEKRENT